MSSCEDGQTFQAVKASWINPMVGAEGFSTEIGRAFKMIGSSMWTGMLTYLAIMAIAAVAAYTGNKLLIGAAIIFGVVLWLYGLSWFARWYESWVGCQRCHWKA